MNIKEQKKKRIKHSMLNSTKVYNISKLRIDAKVGQRACLPYLKEVQEETRKDLSKKEKKK